MRNSTTEIVQKGAFRDRRGRVSDLFGHEEGGGDRALGAAEGPIEREEELLAVREQMSTTRRRSHIDKDTSVPIDSKPSIPTYFVQNASSSTVQTTAVMTAETLAATLAPPHASGTA